MLQRRLELQFGMKGNALNWFASYLCGRSQSVLVLNHHSGPAELQYGVPQGSTLGTVLFTHYYSPISSIARGHGIHVHYYADDTQLYAVSLKERMN